jgi:ACS family D-galactonate transporter-like MFS transporter
MPRIDRATGWTLTAATVLAMSISYVDRQTLNVLAPTVTKALHIDDAAYGWLGSAFNLAYLVGAPIAGALIDRVGARRSLPGAVLVWSLVAALHAVAPGFGVLLGLRLALGLAESPTFPAGVQIVRSALPAEEQPRGTSLLYVGMSLGALAAPKLAIAIATRWSWRWAFVGTGMLAAAWLPVWWWLTRRPDTRGVLDERAPVKSASRLEAALHPAMLRGLVGMLAVTPMSVFMLAWEAKLYVAQAHLAQAELAPYLTASAFLYDIGALVGGDLASRRARSTGDASTPRALFAAGLVVAVAGPLSLSVAHRSTAVLVGMCLSALGRGAVIPLAISDALVRMPKRVAAAAGGVVASAYALAGVIVNPIVGAAVKGGGYVGVVLGLATWTTIVGIAWLAWRPARAPEPARVEAA